MRDADARPRTRRRRFAEGIHAKFPGKLLAYNCSPSFNWKKNLDDATIARFQRELGAMGYKFQFVTLAGFHALNHSMFELARGYRDRGMAAYTELQQAEFAAERHGYTATRHQREVGTGYFDLVATAVSGGTVLDPRARGLDRGRAVHRGGQDRRDARRRAGPGGARTRTTGGSRPSSIGSRRRRTSPPSPAPWSRCTQLLTEHFAHEEHQKGFYGLLSATSPEYRAQVAQMIDEHRELLRTLQELRERTKGQTTPSDLAGLTRRRSAAASATTRRAR